MKQAIIRLQGKIFRISEGDSIVVDRINLTEGQKQIEINEVNLVTDDKKIEIGRPYLKNTKALLEVVNDCLGKKVIARTFHRRKRYIKTKGHRQKQTKLIVKTITTS